MSVRTKDGAYYKTLSMKSIRAALRAAIDRFLCLLPHNKPFSIIADPDFTESEANEVFDALVKNVRKTTKIGGVVHKKAISNRQQLKNLETTRQRQTRTVNVLNCHTSQ